MGIALPRISISSMPALPRLGLPSMSDFPSMPDFNRMMPSMDGMMPDFDGVFRRMRQRMDSMLADVMGRAEKLQRGEVPEGMGRGSLTIVKSGPGYK
jgi:hypothetical protein